MRTEQTSASMSSVEDRALVLAEGIDHQGVQPCEGAEQQCQPDMNDDQVLVLSGGKLQKHHAYPVGLIFGCLLRRGLVRPGDGARGGMGGDNRRSRVTRSDQGTHLR